MKINLTKEIPELAFLIQYSEKIELANQMLQQLLDFQQQIAGRPPALGGQVLRGLGRQLLAHARHHHRQPNHRLIDPPLPALREIVDLLIAPDGATVVYVADEQRLLGLIACMDDQLGMWGEISLLKN